MDLKQAFLATTVLDDVTVEQFAAALLDKYDVPSIYAKDDGGTVQLNTVGRVALALNQRQKLGDALAATAAVEPTAPDIQQARALLAESFRWLQLSDQTQDLRQRIKLYMKGAK